MKILKTTVLLFLACAAVSLWADAHSEAVQKLALIPNAPMIITMDQAAGSPSVVLTDKGALINKATTPVPFDQIVIKLAALPKEAWPDGRAVFYTAAAIGLPAPPKAVADKVELDLEKANIRLMTR